jgi:hypothetical protein
LGAALLFYKTSDINTSNNWDDERSNRYITSAHINNLLPVSLLSTVAHTRVRKTSAMSLCTTKV